MAMSNKKNFLVSLLLCLSLTACLHKGPHTGPYTASSPSVLVKPTIKVWTKPGATEEDERIAGRECGDELRGNEELRKESAKFDEEVRQGLRNRPSKKNRDPWSAAAHACMQRKGFRHYEDP